MSKYDWGITSGKENETTRIMGGIETIDIHGSISCISMMEGCHLKAGIVQTMEKVA